MVRVVYGARCSWWDTEDKMSSTASGLPCCPFCRGVLFEVQSETKWWAGVDAHTAKGDPEYRTFVEWLRGKCFRSTSHHGHGVHAARAQFDAELVERSQNQLASWESARQLVAALTAFRAGEDLDAHRILEDLDAQGRFRVAFMASRLLTATIAEVAEHDGTTVETILQRMGLITAVQGGAQ